MPEKPIPLYGIYLLYGYFTANAGPGQQLEPVGSVPVSIIVQIYKSAVSLKPVQHFSFYNLQFFRVECYFFNFSQFR